MQTVRVDLKTTTTTTTMTTIATALRRLAIGVTALLLVASAGLASARAVEASEPSGGTVGAPAVQQVMPPTGSFGGPVTFSDHGFALAVYRGSIAELEAAAGGAGATGVWVQDHSGRFQLLPVRGPVFLQAGFAAAFPASAGSIAFPQLTAVTLVR
jgi:hypothetical protein